MVRSNNMKSQSLFNPGNSVAKLGIIAMEGAKELGAEIDQYLVNWAKESGMEVPQHIRHPAYYNHLLECKSLLWFERCHPHQRNVDSMESPRNCHSNNYIL